MRSLPQQRHPPTWPMLVISRPARHLSPSSCRPFLESKPATEPTALSLLPGSSSCGRPTAPFWTSSRTTPDSRLCTRLSPSRPSSSVSATPARPSSADCVSCYATISRMPPSTRPRCTPSTSVTPTLSSAISTLASSS